MRKTLIATIAALTALAMALPAAAQKPAWAGPPAEETIVETAVALSGTPFEFDSNADDFDILVAAVTVTGVADDVLNGSEDYTVFAPTDQAFLDLASVLADAPVTDEGDAFDIVAGLGVDTVVAVLSYHVTDGVRNSTSVTKAKQVTMLDGNTITARGGFVDAIGSDADFVATDIRVADGMIHVIDSVLLPI